MASTSGIVIVAFLVCTCCTLSQMQGLDCDPSIAHRFDTCDNDSCCVRDEFLPTWTYCKKLGQENDHCTTHDTETNCPCVNGMTCKPNLVSANGMASLYGRCATVATTTPIPTTTTTTTTTTSTTAAPIVTSTPAGGHSNCPHGHSCEHDHHHTHNPHGHHTESPLDTIG